MALKWGFGKKAADPKAGNGEMPEGRTQDAAPAITERKPLILVGKGFARPLWEDRLKTAGREYLTADQLDDATLAKTEFEVIIETDWHEPGEVLPQRAPALANEGLILLPSYTASPTFMAATVESQAEHSAAYLLFPSPNDKMEASPIIELARPLQATEGTWEKALGFMAGAGFMPEIVGDAPGGVFLRTLALLVNEAASALSDGIATVRDLDDAMQLGLNYPKGPLAWADELGVGFMVEVLQGLMDHYEEDRYRPVPLLCHLLAAGKRFYDLAGLPVQGA